MVFYQKINNTRKCPVADEKILLQSDVKDKYIHTYFKRIFT